MRNVKFKAYQNGTIYNVDTLGLKNGLYPEMCFAHKRSNPHITNENNCVILEDAKFAEYTGLKDKNDVEIYDGDILKTYHDGNKIVHFYRGAFCIDFENRDVGGVNSVSLSYLNTNQMEVIGNIHENPNLL